MEKRKICCACKKEKSTDEFNLNKTKKDGFSTECKSCMREYGIKSRAIRKEKNKNAKPDFRTCPRCGYTKQSSEFHSALTNIDGLSTYCKPCRTELRIKKPEQKFCCECGKPFKTKFTNHIFCSKNCNLKNWWSRLPEDERTEKAKIFHTNDYEKHKSKRIATNKRNAPKYRIELYDCYIKQLIADDCELKSAQIPKQLVEAKRVQLKIKRLINELSNV